MLYKTVSPSRREGFGVSAGPGGVTRLTVIESIGGCCHGRGAAPVEREKAKSRINTVTGSLSDYSENYFYYSENYSLTARRLIT